MQEKKRSLRYVRIADMMRWAAFLFALWLCTCRAAIEAVPPRGWNSYDSYTMNINETRFLANCEAASQLLLPFGYNTCVIDYLWYQSNTNGMWNLDEYCRPIPDVERWPSSANGVGFREVADKVHDMGMNFGIHIMRGTSSFAMEKNCVIMGTSGVRVKDIVATDKGATCPWKPDSVSINVSKDGGQQFYESLYRQYAIDWQVDFIKNDCVFRSARVDEILAQARAIRKFSSKSRSIVYSLSPGTSSDLSDEMKIADAVSDSVNMYRITDDDWDKWADLVVHFDAAAAFAPKIAGTGLLGRPSFPDLDMLPIGFIASPGDEHLAPTRWSNLTRNEQMTQMTLWAIARSPLFFGGDVTMLRDAKHGSDADFTLSLLTNKAVLRVNSHSSLNREILNDDAGRKRAWAASLEDSSDAYACALFNIGDMTGDISVSLRSIVGEERATLNENCSLIDLWSNRSMGHVKVTSNLTIRGIMPHASKFLRLDCA